MPSMTKDMILASIRNAENVIQQNIGMINAFKQMLEKGLYEESDTQRLPEAGVDSGKQGD